MAESDYPAAYVTGVQADVNVLFANFYIEFEGITEKFSKLPVVGLANNVPNLLTNPSLSGASIEVDSSRTPFYNLSFRLNDIGAAVSAVFADEDMLEKTVKLFVSPNKDAGFADYGLKAEFRLKEISSRDANTYDLKCTQTGELMSQRLIVGETILSDDIDDTQTIGISVENFDEFPTSGTRKAYMDKERISFTGVDASGELTGVTRGVDGTTAAEHEEGNPFEIFREITAENFVDTILQLIISPGGGGTYDVLDFGMGIDEDLVDITEFERVRDDTGYLSTSSGDISFRGDEDNFIQFIEAEFFDPSALRFWYRDNGQISLLVLAEPSLADPPDIVKNDMVLGKMPQWKQNSRRIVNRLKIKLNYDPDRNRFTRELIFTDDNSIGKYGLKRTKTISTRALQTGNNALSFLTSFANKYFTFYGTPAPTLEATRLMPPQQFLDPGNVVTVTHPDLPDLALGRRGILEDKVQVLGKTFDFRNFTTSYDIFYSRLLNIRTGFIAPTGTVKAGSWSTTIFEILTADLGKFEVGDVVTLWNDTWASPPVNFSQSTITDVSGDQITVSPAFSTIPLVDYRLRYADYDQVQETQKLFAFIGKTAGGDFDDATPPYKISV